MTNKIDSTVVIQGRVDLGIDNEILPYSVLIGPLSIGNGNCIGPHTTIGTPGQDTRDRHYDSSHSAISIGNGNIIREYTAIQKPRYRDLTSIGNDCYLMQSVHVPHDALIQDDVVVTPMVAMGGLVEIMRGANLGLSCSVHQYSIIGHYSIVAMGAVVTKNVRPFSRFVPGQPITLNEYAIQKFGFTEDFDEIRRYVLEDQYPTAAKLRAIIDEFNFSHSQSKRGLYHG
ncbi:MAG: hypothetical protein EON54_03505 [Alcaligenaceae bacterium]|nr:MAG: hypothetical protein EON54_03505 [Alcaligenaceae bacterium]